MFFIARGANIAELDQKGGDYRDVPRDPIGKL